MCGGRRRAHGVGMTITIDFEAIKGRQQTTWSSGDYAVIGTTLQITCQEADAEALPFEDGSFDVVLSTFGVMFTPNQERSSSELRRVCRSGGRIGLTNWTPTGFIGQMFKIVGGHVPPPAGISSPLLWGTEARLGDLFNGCKVEATTRQFVFRYRSAQHWVDTFRTYYGPTLKAFAALGDEGQALEDELLALATSANTSTNGTLRIPSDYLEVVVTTA